MNILDLPPDLIAHWRQRGWTETRRVEPEVFLVALTQLGGTPLRHGVELLQSIHGLSSGEDDWGCRFELPELLSFLHEGSVAHLQDSLRMQLCPLGIRDADLASAFTNDREQFLILDEGWTCYFICPSLLDFCYWLLGDARCRFTTEAFPRTEQ
jgi:hypothetical protein